MEPAANVILYELNEVPWRVIDLYIEARPASNLAALVRDGQSLTTLNDDPADLSPWRTWPTFHRSMYTEEHNSYELGQDPATFRGTPIWDAVEAAGQPVGLFGPLQSWPPRAFRSGGFYVPDVFSQDDQAIPTSLQRFQAFNLSMTKENTYSSDVPLDKGRVLRGGLDVLRLGMTPASALQIGGHLLRERRDHRHKAARPIIQALPAFDLYWRLHRRHAPRLSMFFTNHVASMMHRFWGDGVPGYAQPNGYAVDEVFAGFITRAMDITDRHLGRIRRYIASHPETNLVVAASMGQGAIPYEPWGSNLFVLDDVPRLAAALNLRDVEVGMAMYPCYALALPDDAAAQTAACALQSVAWVGFGPMFHAVVVQGRTVTFVIEHRLAGTSADATLHFQAAGRSDMEAGKPGDLGIRLRDRIGGGNTAYHVPEGMLLAYGGRVGQDRSRREVSVLDASPSILESFLEIEAPSSMRGRSSLFTAA